MPDRAHNVSPKIERISESLAKDLIARAVTSVRAKNGDKPGELAEKIGCEESTIKNAERGDNLMRANFLFNLLAVDPLALEGLLHHFDRRSVPITAKCNTDALAPTAAAVHKIALAQADGAITDRECLDIEPELDAAIEALSTLKERCHAIRNTRAAA